MQQQQQPPSKKQQQRKQKQQQQPKQKQQQPKEKQQHQEQKHTQVQETEVKVTSTKVSTSTDSEKGPKRGNKNGRKTEVFVVRDSMARNMKSCMMSRVKSVKVHSFSGATIEDMKYFIKPLLARQPHYIILHVGTNNILRGDTNTLLNHCWQDNHTILYYM